VFNAVLGFYKVIVCEEWSPWAAVSATDRKLGLHEDNGPPRGHLKKMHTGPFHGT
jgi:hypothetical protein